MDDVGGGEGGGGALGVKDAGGGENVLGMVFWELGPDCGGCGFEGGLCWKITVSTNGECGYRKRNGQVTSTW